MTTKRGFVRFSSFWVFPALGIACLLAAYRYEPGNTQVLFWSIPSGLIMWTLLEYGLHRFVFHTEVRNPAVQRIINGSHLTHHEAPRDREHILVQLPYALTVSVILALIIGLIGRSFSGTAGLLTGIWAGFLYYELVHYRVHATPSNGWLLSRQRHAHFYHHYHDSNRCFGVTTPLWDYVFGTAEKAREISIPSVED